MKNIKGQWNILSPKQKYILKHYACVKEWKRYWLFKEIFLSLQWKSI